MLKHITLLVSLGLLTAGLGHASENAIESADEIVQRANMASYYAGADGRSEVRMIITDAQGRLQRRAFTVLRRNIELGADQQFLVHFTQPSDVRGTLFLVQKHTQSEDDRWLYLPGLDLVKRISAGDKRTSFVGAHYFYEDVSGRDPLEDTHELTEVTETQYVLHHRPKAPKEVEFESYRTWIDRTTMLPMKIEYTNSAGKVYRSVEVLEVEVIQGHPTVTASRVRDLVTGAQTDMMFRHIRYDLGVPGDLFSERSLRTPPREWLARPKD